MKEEEREREREGCPFLPGVTPAWCGEHTLALWVVSVHMTRLQPDECELKGPYVKNMFWLDLFFLKTKIKKNQLQAGWRARPMIGLGLVGICFAFARGTEMGVVTTHRHGSRQPCRSPGAEARAKTLDIINIVNSEGRISVMVVRMDGLIFTFLHLFLT
jgi:hypothetical protein